MKGAWSAFITLTGRRDDAAAAIQYQRHPEQRALARVSKDAA